MSAAAAAAAAAAAITNGGSLEDCHTNVFVLAELTGLKWKKLVPISDHPSMRHHTADQATHTDPILAAYSRCVSARLLCAWRRCPPSAQCAPQYKPDMRLDAAKELWCFWYGDEPEPLKAAVSAFKLSAEDEDYRGSYSDKGIEYETRCMIFKALHVALERALLPAGYVRLGRWFARPLPVDTSSRQRYTLAVSFAFFVHGEANVCVEVLCQRQPALGTLGWAHLLQALAAERHESERGGGEECAASEAPPAHVHVQLAPFCLTGRLSTNADTAAQVVARRRLAAGGAAPHQLLHEPAAAAVHRDKETQWREWAHFYNLPAEHDEDDQTANVGYEDPLEREKKEADRIYRLPKMVDVIVDGVRLYYPSSLVLVLKSDDPTGPSGEQQPDTPAKGTRSNVGTSPTRHPGRKACPLSAAGLASPANISHLYRHFHLERPVSATVASQRTVEFLITSANSSSATSLNGAGQAAQGDAGAQQASTSRTGTPNATAGDSCAAESGGGMRWPYVDPAGRDQCACSSAACSAAATTSSAGPAPQLDVKPLLQTKAALKQTPNLSHVGSSVSLWQSQCNQNSLFHQRAASAGNLTQLATPTVKDELKCPATAGIKLERADSASMHKTNFPPVTPQPATPSATCYPASCQSGGLHMNPPSSGVQLVSPVQPAAAVGSAAASQQPGSSATVAGGTCALAPGCSAAKPTDVARRGGKRKRSAAFALNERTATHPSFNVPPAVRLKQAGRRPKLDKYDISLLYDKQLGEYLDSGKFCGHAAGHTRTWELCRAAAPPSTVDLQVHKSDISSSDELTKPAIGEAALSCARPGRAIAGGPPSVEYIYPTPPSVLDAHLQLSPAAAVSALAQCRPHPAVGLAAGQSGTAHVHGNLSYESALDTSGEEHADHRAPVQPDIAPHQGAHKRGRRQIFRTGGPRGSAALPSKFCGDIDALVERRRARPAIRAPVEYKPSGGPTTTPLGRSSDCVPLRALPALNGAGGAPVHSGAAQLPPMPAASPLVARMSTPSWACGASMSRSVSMPASRMGQQLSPLNAGMQSPAAAAYPNPDSVGGAHSFSGTGPGSVGAAPLHQHQQQHAAQQHQQHVGGPASVGPHLVTYAQPDSVPPVHSVHSPHSVGVCRAPASVDNSAWQQQQLHQQQQVTHQQQAMTPLGNPASVPLGTCQQGGGAALPQWHVHAAQLPGVKPHQANSLLLNVLLSDTLLDIYRDAWFDSCPLCACHANISAGSELAHYVPRPPTAPSPGPVPNNKCSCGFSAVRYRSLAYAAGLFHEDEGEAGPRLARMVKNEPVDAQLAELIREHSQTTDLAADVFGTVLVQRQADDALKRRELITDRLTTTNFCDYVAPHVELLDLAVLEAAALDAALVSAAPDANSDPCTWTSSLGASPGGGSRARGRLAHGHLALQQARGPPSLQCGGATSFRPLDLADWGCQRAVREPEPDDGQALALLHRLAPLLAQALAPLHQGCGMSQSPVEGPLTWRGFERRLVRAAAAPGASAADRGAAGLGAHHEDRCRPEPVPQVAVRADGGESVALSPAAVRLWDRLLLEPHAPPKDVLYVVVMPDNRWLVDRAKVFFRELSKTYENHRFGTHCPFSREGLPDGVLKVGANTASLVAGAGAGESADRFEEHARSLPAVKDKAQVEDKLRAYRLLCRHVLARLLHADAQSAFDATVFRRLSKESQSGSANLSGANESMPPPAAPVSAVSEQHAGANGGGPTGNSNAAATSADPSMDGDLGMIAPHTVVVYMVNPFTVGAENHVLPFARLVSQALLKCYSQLLAGLPEKLRPRVQLEVVPVAALLDASAVAVDWAKDARAAFISMPLDEPWRQGADPRHLGRLSAADALRTLAFNVYSRCRALPARGLLSVCGKTLTCFGPAARRQSLLEGNEFKQRYYRLSCPPFVLAPPSSVGQSIPVPVAKNAAALRPVVKATCDHNTRTWSDEAVLLVNYCLSENQKWLLATASDQRGAFIENCVVNLSNFAAAGTGASVDRNAAKHASVIHEALARLWNFVMGVLATGAHPWHLVLGRLGRMGHGELKTWSHMLHRTALRKFGAVLRDKCAQCRAAGAASAAGAGHPPSSHADCPSILSACLISIEPEPGLRLFAGSFAHDQRFAQTSKQCPLSTPDDVSSTHIVVFPTSATIQLSCAAGGSGPGGLNGSGTGDNDMDGDEFDRMLDELDLPEEEGLVQLTDLQQLGAGMQRGSTMAEHSINIDQQPLALGLWISTAPPAPGLPTWFWSSSPSGRLRSPTHLRAALHIKVAGLQQSDEQLAGWGGGRTAAHRQQHPLEAQHTADVLRYVLETYNALSWLGVDVSTGDRRSCLPAHVQALLRLYRGAMTLLPL